MTTILLWIKHAIHNVRSRTKERAGEMNEIEQERHSLLANGAMGVRDAMVWTGLGRSALYDLMARGDLAYVKLGKRRLIPRNALMELLETHRILGANE